MTQSEQFFIESRIELNFVPNSVIHVFIVYAMLL